MWRWFLKVIWKKKEGAIGLGYMNRMPIRFDFKEYITFIDFIIFWFEWKINFNKKKISRTCYQVGVYRFFIFKNIFQFNKWNCSD